MEINELIKNIHSKLYVRISFPANQILRTITNWENHCEYVKNNDMYVELDWFNAHFLHSPFPTPTILSNDEINTLLPQKLAQFIDNSVWRCDTQINIVNYRIFCANGYSVDLARGENCACNVNLRRNYEVAIINPQGNICNPNSLYDDGIVSYASLDDIINILKQISTL